MNRFTRETIYATVITEMDVMGAWRWPRNMKCFTKHSAMHSHFCYSENGEVKRLYE